MLQDNDETVESGGIDDRSGSGIRTFILLLTIMSALAAPALWNYAPEDYTMGINYGRVDDNLPAPTRAVKLASGLGIGRVRLFLRQCKTCNFFVGWLIVGAAGNVGSLVTAL